MLQVFEVGIPVMVDFSGQTIDDYLLLHCLGEGAFGEVYLAEQVYRGTLFAVKVLRPQFSQEDLQIFLNEARVFRLVHPNIMRIRDFGIDKDTPFIVMDYLPGGTLRAKHPRGNPLPLPMIVSYVKQLADALQFAHDEGLVHRDVKPENMLVGAHNQIVLSDFGIVTHSYTWSEDDQSGIAGTAIYMAPEQIRARAVRASDQYALAALTYEWLVGTPPFMGSILKIAEMHLYQQPQPLRQRNPAVPLEVEQVVLRALEKDYTRRFPSVREFAIALGKASKLPVGTTLQTLSMSASLLPSLAWSPDGQRLAVASSNGTVKICPAEQGETLTLSGERSQQIAAIAWSPDGSRLAAGGEDRVLRIWDATTGKLSMTCTGHHAEVYTLAWSPDGSMLASGGADRALRVWDARSGQAIRVIAGHNGDILHVAWSPDGTKLASASYGGTIQVYTMPSCKLLWLTSSFSTVYGLAWSHDGTRLAAASYDATIQVRSAATGQALQIYRGHNSSVFAVAWSPDDAWLASGGDDATVHLWETVTGKVAYIYRGHERGIRALAWSPTAGHGVSSIASSGLDQKVLIWQGL